MAAVLPDGSAPPPSPPAGRHTLPHGVAGWFASSGSHECQDAEFSSRILNCSEMISVINCQWFVAGRCFFQDPGKRSLISLHAIHITQNPFFKTIISLQTVNFGSVPLTFPELRLQRTHESTHLCTELQQVKRFGKIPSCRKIFNAGNLCFSFKERHSNKQKQQKFIAVRSKWW